MWVNIGLVVFIIILLLILSMVWPPDSPWAPWWRTKNDIARKALKLAKVTKKDVVYDLGCGDAGVVIVATRDFGVKAVGIEIDPLRFLLAKLLVRKNGVSDRVAIIKDNFNKQNISSATVVFLYLVPRALERLKPKLLRELKKGTRIVTYKYQFSLKKVREDKKNQLFLYKM